MLSARAVPEETLRPMRCPCPAPCIPALLPLFWSTCQARPTLARYSRHDFGRQLSSHSRRLFAGSAQRHTKKKENGLCHLRLVTHLFGLRDSPLWKGGQLGKVGSPQKTGVPALLAFTSNIFAMIFTCDLQDQMKEVLLCLFSSVPSVPTTGIRKPRNPAHLFVECPSGGRKWETRLPYPVPSATIDQAS